MAPPELIDDAVAEILLRLPPQEPRCLFRASLVCKPWRRLLTDAAFLRQYRRFHRTPPLLGFFIVSHAYRGEAALRFISTTSASPFPPPAFSYRPWHPLDCRHGRLLLQKMQGGNFAVGDPITGAQEELRVPGPFASFSVAVLCAAAGCDHRDCHGGGPFLVVWVWKSSDHTEGLAHARVYSSQLGSWGTTVSVHVGLAADDFINPSRGALVGDDVYFMVHMGDIIIKYDLAKHHISLIDLPESYAKGIFIVPTEDGLLGVAGIRGSSLYLWSRKADAEGVEGWIQHRVIELRNLLPVGDLFKTAMVIGFAESVRVIFVSTDVGRFIIDLSSEQVRRVSEPGTDYPLSTLDELLHTRLRLWEITIASRDGLITAELKYGRPDQYANMPS